MGFLNFLIKYFQIKDADSIQVGEIKSIHTHSQEVQNESLFVALRGQREDGHNYIKDAIQKGAKALLVEDSSQIPSDFKGLVLKSKDTRKDLSILLNEYYQFPSQKLFTIGVTGTNGKTTISYMIEHIFNSCGWPTAVIGTVDQHFKEKKWSAQLTTPDSLEIFERLESFINLEAKACVMEVSSIGLDQRRVAGVDFKAAIWTNLSWDHMDYHSGLEDYFQSKKKLFINNSDKNFFSIINSDDNYGQKLIKNLKSNCYTYGSKKSDFNFKIKDQNLSKTVFDLKTPFGSTTVELPLLGYYNVYNAVASLACATIIGFKLEESKKALESFKGVSGRLQKVTDDKNSFQVFVDYAHTPLAIASVLKTLKTFKEDKNLIIVFGCGGDRDKEKRSPMVQEAIKFADKVFFTSDNSRFESPDNIVKDGLKDLENPQKMKVRVEMDREKAIKESIFFAKEGDIVLIAGKGHEKFQIVGERKIPFDDLEIAKKYLKERFQ